MSIKLELEGIGKKFKNQKEVLQNISFLVEEGEFLSILGPSGCGKTTLLRIIIGLADADCGTVRKDGQDISHLETAKRGMGIVFQNYALFQNMTVLGNVEYALKRRKETKRTAREKALEMLEQTGLTQWKDARPGQLSGGQQQRVAIARSLVLNPDIMLFDEPMSALDANTRTGLREEIKRIQKQFKTTMLYVTHDQEEAFSMSDRILVLKDGVKQQLDTPAEILKHPATPFVEQFVRDNLKTKYQSLAGYLEALS